MIRADTHEQAADLVRRHVRPAGRVLYVGAGAGAFSRRPADLGYCVTALDVDASEWPSVNADSPFYELDVGKGVAGSILGRYDMVCCLEVIEHLENPWAFFRDVRSVLEPGAVFIVSTPNISSFLSRIVFLATGRFHGFGKEDVSYGHISPISSFELELELVVRSTGFDLLEVRPGGYLPVFDFSAPRPAKLALNVVRGLLYPLMRGNKQGWCLFFVLRNQTVT